MSNGSKILVSLLCSILSGLIAGWVWSPGAGLFVSLAVIVGIILGSLIERHAHATRTLSSSPQPVKEKESALELTHSMSILLEAVLGGMREGVLISDPEMQIVMSNTAARAIFNRERDEWKRTRLSQWTRNPVIHHAFRAALERNERSETTVTLTGDERRVCDLIVYPLRVGAEEKARAAICILFDTTQLERLERVRQEFLTNVSHEMRTPLTSILAFVETLEEGAIEDAESARRFLSIIRQSAARLHILIKDILELSAIEAGAIKIEKEQIKLRALVQDICAALNVKAEAHGIALRNEIGADVSVFADTRRLEQMLLNLIDNAIKFNRENGSVTIHHEAKEGRDLIRITDTGDGISGEHIERIFERFYRVDRARSREIGGTGLGLSIVKHLARAHNGEVSVHSIPREGSTFVIELPAAAGAPVEEIQG